MNRMILYLLCIVLCTTSYSFGQKYMGIFVSSEHYEKNGKFITLKFHIPKASRKVRNVHKLIIQKLLEEKWEAIEATEISNRKIVEVFLGLDFKKYKKGTIKKGDDIVILERGVDYPYSIDSSSKKMVYAEEIVKKINSID